MTSILLRCAVLVLGMLCAGGVAAGAPQDHSSLLEAALARAGTNASEMRDALERVPDEQRADLEFLLVHMPGHDIQSLTADFLLENVRFAREARDAAPWGERIPRDVFLDALLPYASVNERRDAWRSDFRERFLPVVAECETASAAAAKLNQTIFGALNVRYSRDRPKADQSPYESMEATTASCTGLSILLIDACRAVGVPARFVGTPRWADGSGNHSWVEVWDDGWHFTGAAEPTGGELDRGWFLARASQAKPTPSEHAIYAVSYRRTPLTFPTIWNPRIDYVHAVDVTERYTKQAAPLPEGMARVQIRVVEDAGGRRVPARIIVTNPADGTTVFEGTSKDERFDGNDHLTIVLPLDAALRVNAQYGERFVRRPITVAADLPTVDIHLADGISLFSGSSGPPPPPAYPSVAPREVTIPPAPHLPSLEVIRSISDYVSSGPAEREEAVSFEDADAYLRAEPTGALELTWSSYRWSLLDTAMAADFAADRVTFEDYAAPYVAHHVGERPANGWPLFIAMHGGGGVPKELNDSQWRHMQVYYKDQPDLGGYVYLALRAPNDTWNGFYDWYMPPLIESLIRQFTAFGDVDPDRVFLMGYSHGGYGAFYIGPKLADRFAAVHVSAAAPTGDHAAPDNLRNTRFSVMVGELDNAYGRRELCLAFAEQVEAVRSEDDESGAFPVTLEVMEGRPHSGLPDRDKIRSMYDAVREPLPRHITWKMTDDRVRFFHWLHVPTPKAGSEVEAILGDNRVEITTKDVDVLHVYLDERMIDYSRPVTIVVDGEERILELTPSLKTLCDSLLERGDPRFAFSSRVVLDTSSK